MNNPARRGSFAKIARSLPLLILLQFGGKTAALEIIGEQSAASSESSRIRFDRNAIRSIGWDVLIQSPSENDVAAEEIEAFPSAPQLTVSYNRDGAPMLTEARFETSGAVMLIGPDRRFLIHQLSLRHESDEKWTLSVIRNEGEESLTDAVFRLEDDLLQIDSATGQIRFSAAILATGELGGDSDGIILGRIFFQGHFGQNDFAERSAPGNFRPEPVIKRTSAAIGPDVIVGNLHNLGNYGASGGISAFSVGTVSCNVGDAPAVWFSNTNQHPVIGQNMFRLKGGRFEQIGMSWLKHGFFALSETLCSSNCQGTNGTYLGVNCSDPYSAFLNGQQANLGPRYQVNAHTGFFNYPPANPSYHALIGRRLQVANSDLDPNLNAGALYFVEGHYVTPDDAAAGNQNNNASYRPITITNNGSPYNANLAGSTVRQKPAIRAWRAQDPTVVEADVQVPGEGLFIVAGKATELGGGNWQYEYAVQNLNSHRSGKAFSVPVDPEGTIHTVGFHDVNYHSGEPFSGTDWTSSVSNGWITWTTEDFSVNQNANALRWGTLYNFRFSTNRPPRSSNVQIELFRTGTPASVSTGMIGPILSAVDCDDNGVPDQIDIDNGTHADCNGNEIPDICESYPLGVVRVAEGLDQPVYVTAPAGDPRLFIVEQSGRIRILSGGSVLPTPFLNLTSLVSSTGERGLLSMSFDPEYATTGHFFVNYTNLSGDTVIARYQVSADPNVANATSGTTLKLISQDLFNHNGGQLQFGPDGFLYVGMGDGGGSYDPFNRAQDAGTLLGKMLRLDVHSPPAYIPESNPYSDPGLPLDEIWAMGLRNPWRFSFDRLTGDLYIADVGQDSREEINFQPAGFAGGANYGWRCMEGAVCTGLSGCTCGSGALTAPIHEYDHSNGDCSITGGYVYRGCSIPNLRGAYLYADFCTGTIRSFRVDSGVATDHEDLTPQLTPDEGPIESIVSFGEDGSGELYIVSRVGEIYRIVPDPEGGGVCGNGTLEPGEQCDDGNTSPGDGCDEFCEIETGPPNDRCILPTIVTEDTVEFDNFGGSTDGPADAGTCVGDPEGIGKDVWFCYTPSQTGTVEVSTCGSFINTVVTVYPGCGCPEEGTAIACNNNACGSFGTNSSVSFPATACESYMIRVGGLFGDEGSGLLTVEIDPTAIVNDCDGNGIDDLDDILCGTQHDSNHNGIPDTCETDGDFVRGGRLYDRWWVEAALPEPTEDHPLWSLRPDLKSNEASGATTWRCTECHGWDYQGVDGQFATGPHRTGFPGVLGTTLDGSELFTLLKEPPDNVQRLGLDPFYGHAYGSVLPDTRINDLVAFLLIGSMDTNPYIHAKSGDFQGDPVEGQNSFESGPAPACIACHGAAGTEINFGTPTEPKYIGTIAVNNPWELLHKIRFGQPAAPMPSWVAGGGSTQGAANIGRYAQLEFPIDCTLDDHCNDDIACTLDLCDENGRCVYEPDSSSCSDDGVFCNGAEVCIEGQGCASPGNPCTVPAACNEAGQSCGCLPPDAFGIGCRYLAITPHAESSGIPMALKVSADCGGTVTYYLRAPAGPYNVAFVTTDPAQAAYLTPVQWGGTVYATGVEIAPETHYEVSADCGVPSQPVLTATSSAVTPVWGDTFGSIQGSPYHDGNVNVLDVSAVVDGVRELPMANPMYVLDLYGCNPNQRVDVIDISGVVDAIKGITNESGSLCPGPCW